MAGSDHPADHDAPEVRVFTPDGVDDLARLFATEPSAHGCWCMWFITSVKDYHAAGAAGNRHRFEALAEASEQPLGLLAYRAGEPIAWCAVGPRSRYARAVKTPTMKAMAGHADASRWFVPCFFVHPAHRGTGVTGLLLARAVELAAEHGAHVVEGFPMAAGRPASGGDRQVGGEAVFTRAGFDVVHRPSPNRVLVRRAVSPADAVHRRMADGVG